MSLPEELLPEPPPAEPLSVAAQWLAEAFRRGLQPNPNAMVLATVSVDGCPSARVVLCKDLVPVPGYLVFYTNYHSRKGQELAQNARAAAVLHWDHLHRQVRVEGRVVTAPAADSDRYFASRPWQSRVGAWASEQSSPIRSRADLQEAVANAAKRLGVPVPGSESNVDPGLISIPRPPHWGGYRLWAEAVELWTEGAARIHDRIRWTRTLQPSDNGEFEPGAWQATRLQP